MLIGILPMPIGYYSLVRVIVFVCSLYLCFKIYEKKKNIGRNHELCFFAIIALIYNQIFQIYLNVQLIWIVIILLTAYLFFRYKNLLQ